MKLNIFTLLTLTLSLLSHKTLAQNIVPAMDGTGTIVNHQGNQFNIQGGQLSGNGRNLFHTFQQLGLSQGQIANFISNPQIQNILGRINGGDPSIINGLIQVTGGNSNLYLMNPAGIVFGPNAQLNIPADFTATTATGIGFGNGQWFNAVGDNNWSQLVGTPNEFRFDVNGSGSIVNFGDLKLSEGSNLTLMGANVINLGTLEAPGGTINIVAIPDQQIIRITQEGHLLSLDIPLEDERQEPEITPLNLPELLTHSGLNHANQLEINEQGQIVLSSSGVEIPNINGVSIISGTLNTASENGGTINIMGDRIGVIDATLDVSGLFDGGTLRIGGDFKGNPTFPTADITYINENSILNAGSEQLGDGGNIFIWSENLTQFDGTISAPGGVEGGDGGFAEISSRNALRVDGDVDLSANNGDTGQLLIDPKNVTIIDGNNGPDDSKFNKNEILFSDDPGADWIISEEKLEQMLQNGHITIEATNNITIEDLSNDVLGDESFTHSLTFTADQDKDGSGSFSMNSGDTIRTQGSVTISGYDLTLGNIITSSDSRNSGSVTLDATGKIQAGEINTTSSDYQGGDVVINSENHVDIENIETSSLFDHAGNVDINSGGDLNLSFVRARVEDTSATNANGGTIDIDVQGNIDIPSEISTSSDAQGGNGGNVTVISHEGDMTIGGVGTKNSLLQTTYGDGGSITLRANQGDITINGLVQSYVESGDGGDVFIEAGEKITIDGSIRSIAETSGNGGKITLIAGDDIDLGGNVASGALTSRGGQSNGADISITSKRGTLTANNIISGVFGSGDAGDITIQTDGDITLGTNSSTLPTGYVWSGSTAGQAGEITITSTNGKFILAPTPRNLLEHNIAHFCNSSLTCDTNGNVISGTITFTITGQEITLNFDIPQSTPVDSGTSDSGTGDSGTGDSGIGDSGIEDPGTGDPGTGDSGTGDSGIEDPGTGDSGIGDSGIEDPGTGDSGIEDPGTGDSGIEDPGTGDSGTGDSGTGDSGIEDPGTEDPVDSDEIEVILTDAEGDELTGTTTVIINDNPDGGGATFQVVSPVEITADRNFDVPSILSGVLGGNGGNVTITAPGGIQVGDVRTPSLVIGDGGDVAGSSSGGGIQTNVIDTSANIGDGGNIALDAQQAIQTADLNTPSLTVGNGGNVALSSSGSSITTGDINTFANIGNAGNVDIQALLDINVGDINASTIQGNGGNVLLNSDLGNVFFGEIDVSSQLGNPGQIAISDVNSVLTTETANEGEPQALESVNQEQNPVVEPQIETEIAVQLQPQPQRAIAMNPVNTPSSSVTSNLSELDRFAIDLASLNLEWEGIQETWDQRLQELDQLMTEEYSQYVKKDPSEIVTIAGIKDMLSTIEAQTGNKPAVVYALSHPNVDREGVKLEGQLVLVLVTSEGVAKATTVDVNHLFGHNVSNNPQRIAKAIYEELEGSRGKNPTLVTAQKAYKALISPLEEQMEAQGIDTLMFSVDNGLRSIPLGMLHDGEQFLIEKYNIALIPSVTLTNSTYEGLENASVLAMGASEFPNAIDRDPLPSVPLELEMIGSGNWHSDRFLNEDFTLERMKTQRLSRRYDIVHLATHANFKNRDSTQLEFWDQTISLETLREFDWHEEPQVELLVLSACQTAIGDLDAELGFAGLAIRAGVKSSVASLWKVDDLSTVVLMTAFYEYLQTEPIKAEALRQAQLAMLRGEIFIENGELVTPHNRVALPETVVSQLKNRDDSRSLSHPFHWAGFTVVGSPW
ncbi:CHAT domain-containing protein [Roseofilum capinflatum]|uniref:CHAT domain-containing protein n=1 Tax=Roseofilum capinflatum BLCC-M114 TaxID=3022440 RepID=A0ABT7BA39_9CYAN|nr:CHAT domain-containing protein [Roseofilum capinflatum]MDJ1176052.1 CHAT domain-containing protein [Roseofilum capinflatum BLCC-M114]